MKIVIVGAGNMGMTYIKSFLHAHAASKEELIILEKDKKRIQEIQKEGFSHVYDYPNEEISGAKLIILAVKPQGIQDVFSSLRPFINEEQLVLSIMAGITLETLKKNLATDKIFRAMPNLPSQIGMGMTGFTADSSVSRQELLFVQNLINTTGKSLYFAQESKIDAVTAISGSGPAYIYYFMDAMIQKAKGLGFTESEAETMVSQTFMGALSLENRSNYSCKEWINKVASKGGTTEAALHVFGKRHVQEAIGKGIEAAFERAKELGADGVKVR